MYLKLSKVLDIKKTLLHIICLLKTADLWKLGNTFTFVEEYFL